jgi:uroporphyrinogen-III synthase
MTTRVLVTRPAEHGDELTRALSARGLDAIHVPAVAIDVPATNPELDAAVADIERYAWLVVTSANGARAVTEALRRTGGMRPPAGRPRLAAVGTATASRLETEGHVVGFIPSTATAATLAEELPITAGERVLVARGNLAGSRVAERLRERGAVVDDVVAYRTIEGPAASRGLLQAALRDSAPAAVLFASGSAARGLAELASREALDVLAIPAVAIGHETATTAREAGFDVVAIAASPHPQAIAAATSEALSRAPEPVR